MLTGTAFASVPLSCIEMTLFTGNALGRRTKMKIAALIVAAGRGTRLGASVPKQYQPLLGRPLLSWTLEPFLAHAAIHGVAVVIHGEDRALYDDAVRGLAVLPPVIGAETRQGSVRAGLEALARAEFDAVLIHDAARPFVSPALIGRVVAGLGDSAGVLPGIPVVDSLRRVRAGSMVATAKHAGMVRAQTPQGFRLAAILQAHRAAEDRDIGDDAAVLHDAGGHVTVVPGDEDNFKVTDAADMERAEATALARLGEVRTGLGFDVHRFGPGDHVTLCGVRIAHGQGLVGHSDADVGLHALTDAILGAIAEGDIGQAFPPTDPRWKGAASDIFLAHARDRVAAQRGAITHVDVTLVCEQPRITRHREAMRQRVAEILGLDVRRVSVKATTTERLGFTGRGEGIAAHAIATVRMP